MPGSGELIEIRVQLFSILRDCLPSGAERGRVTVTLPQAATVAELVRYLGIDRFLGYNAEEMVSHAGWQVMISGRYEPDVDRILQDRDEVLILPFISGG